MDSFQRRLTFTGPFWILASLLVSPSCSLEVVSGIQVSKAPLRRGAADGPYCFVAQNPTQLRRHDNFLATQVWPSARLAATCVEAHLNKEWTVCELGCGPGLPALTAAHCGSSKVYATDIDSLALKMLQAAAKEQKLDVETSIVDLTSDEPLPDADLYILSDVFETGRVAEGAARVVEDILSSQARVWVFAQTDRAQREVFLETLKKRCNNPSLAWCSPGSLDFANEVILLVDVDENNVLYG